MPPRLASRSTATGGATGRNDGRRHEVLNHSLPTTDRPYRPNAKQRDG